MSNNKKVIGYIPLFISTDNSEEYKAEIKRMAKQNQLDIPVIIEESVSGKINWNHRFIGNIARKLNNGDFIIVKCISNLGISIIECMEILSYLVNKGINIYSADFSFDSRLNMSKDILTSILNLVLSMEKQYISNRIKKSLNARKENGVKLGRPKGVGKSKLDKNRVDIELLLLQGWTQRAIAKKYDTTEANLHNWLKKRNIEKISMVKTYKNCIGEYKKSMIETAELLQKLAPDDN